MTDLGLSVGEVSSFDAVVGERYRRVEGRLCFGAAVESLEELGARRVVVGIVVEREVVEL